MIFGALDIPGIQASDKYLKRIIPNSTNFLQAAEVKEHFLAYLSER